MLNLMSDLRQKIVAAARECLGTPYHHQGRVVGVGLDCIGLLQHPAKRLKLTSGYDKLDYPTIPDGVTLQKHLEKAGLIEIPVDEADVGDIGGFFFGRGQLVRHAGIFSSVGLIHTWTGVGRVVEHGFDTSWRRRLAIAYRYPGVV